MSDERNSLALRVDLLGPLAVRVAGRTVEVAGSRRRALLALLAIESGRVVSKERLVESLWPDDPPTNAAQAVYNLVSRLRVHLGEHSDRLQRRGSGYALHLERDELDVEVAQRLAVGVSAAATPAEAAATAREALNLWRGPALGEFRAVPALEVESVGLDELRLRLVDDLTEARLAAGERAVAAEAAAAAAAAPLRERAALLHVRALAAEGRTAEAMTAAQAFRGRLVEETGLDPSPALADLEQLVASGAVGPHSTSPARRVVARPDGPLVGRQHDRDEILRLLAAHGIVTVTGPGGVGKTRLALDVAADPAALPTPDADVVVVELAAVDRPERLCQAVASTLGLLSTGEVRPDDVGAALAVRSLLLVLDNCEHLVDACRDLVVAVRRRAAHVSVLATSRSTLQVPGEYVVRLQPLPVPRDAADLDALRRLPSVRAFIEHARRRRADFEVTEAEAADVVEVLRRLDGLPLGIELAARQVGVMPVRAVRERLDRALDLATGRQGPDDDRQRTLRASVDSSYRLLADHEQRLLRALAPFPGGVELGTVESLAEDLGAAGDPLDVLHRLVDSSLLVADAASGRYRLLFTVRMFLLDELREHGELTDAETRFLDRCLDLAAEIGVRIFGPDEPQVDRRLRAELDNLRAARDVADAHRRDDVRIGLTTLLAEAAALRDLHELWTWALDLVEDRRLAEHPDWPLLLSSAAEAARLVGDLDRSEALVERAFVAAGSDPQPRVVRGAWQARASVSHFRGDFSTARDAWLRGEEGRSVRSGSCIASAALAAAYGGDHADARQLLDRAHAEIARSGCLSHAAFASYVEGELRVTGDVAEAVPYYLDAIETARRAGAPFVEGVASVGLASARARLGDVAAAADGFARLISYWQRTGQQTQLWTTARNAAALLAATGHTRAAALLVAAADEVPGAAAVGPDIARRGSRAFVPVGDLVDPDTEARLRAEARMLTPPGVLGLATGHLAEVAAAGSGRKGRAEEAHA